MNFPKGLRALVLLLLAATCFEATEAFLAAHPLQPPGPSWWLTTRPLLHLVAATGALFGLAKAGERIGRWPIGLYAATSLLTTIIGAFIQWQTLSKASQSGVVQQGSLGGLHAVMVGMALVGLLLPSAILLLLRNAPKQARHPHAIYLLGAVNLMLVAIVGMRMFHTEPALVQVMVDKTDPRRALAAEKLGGTQEFLVLSALAGMVRDAKEPQLVKASMGALAKSGAASLPFLDAMLKSDAVSERRQGALITRWLKGPDKVRAALLPATIVALRGTEGDDLEVLLKAVRHLGTQATPAILPKLKPFYDDIRPRVRQGTFVAIGAIPGGCEAGLPALKKGLGDFKDTAAMAAARALLQCKDAGESVLSAELRSDSEQRQLRAIRALGKPWPKPAAWSQGWPLVQIALLSPFPSVQVQALEVLTAAKKAGVALPQALTERALALAASANSGVSDRVKRLQKAVTSTK